MIANKNYRDMWEDLGEDAGRGYHEIKFRPTYRIGLTNYLREKLIYQFLNPTSTDIVLDVGCASGRQIFRIAHIIGEGYGVDVAQSFINEANARKKELGTKNVTFSRSEGEELPYHDHQFSKVMCAEVLEHVPNKDVMLKEILRVLQPGGTLVLSVPNLNADGTLWGRFLRLLGVRKFQPLTEFSHKAIKEHGDAHVREFTSNTMRRWLEVHGLHIEHILTVSFIDGPGFDFLLKVPLHIPPLRILVVWLERVLTLMRLPFGRHIVVKARKPY